MGVQGLSVLLRDGVAKISLDSCLKGVNQSQKSIIFLVDAAHWPFPAGKSKACVEEIVTPFKCAAPSVVAYMERKCQLILDLDTRTKVILFSMDANSLQKRKNIKHGSLLWTRVRRSLLGLNRRS